MTRTEFEFWRASTAITGLGLLNVQPEQLQDLFRAARWCDCPGIRIEINGLRHQGEAKAYVSAVIPVAVADRARIRWDDSGLYVSADVTIEEFARVVYCWYRDRNKLPGADSLAEVETIVRNWASIAEQSQPPTECDHLTGSMTGYEDEVFFRTKSGAEIEAFELDINYCPMCGEKL